MKNWHLRALRLGPGPVQYGSRQVVRGSGSAVGQPRRANRGQELEIPPSLSRPHQGRMSTQQTFGADSHRDRPEHPEVAERIVTVTPDVASSTSLGGWINKVGVWARTEGHPMPEDIPRALRWEESPDGQHLELGISENNLFVALGQLGSSFEAHGELLFPIGTLYDPFVRRGLDALFYSAYSGAKFIFVGTPSGVSLGPEGGMHQSVMTPSIGAELPDTAFYEPCFGQGARVDYAPRLGPSATADRVILPAPYNETYRSSPVPRSVHRDRRREAATPSGSRLLPADRS